MVMKAGPIYRALQSVERLEGHGPVVLFSPQGEPFTQEMAWEWLNGSRSFWFVAGMKVWMNGCERRASIWNFPSVIMCFKWG
jgi:tRNA G37 N-methylase TrmD